MHNLINLLNNVHSMTLQLEDNTYYLNYKVFTDDGNSLWVGARGNNLPELLSEVACDISYTND